MDVALKPLHLEAVDGCYLNKVKNNYTNYLGMTIMVLVDELMDPYVKIIPVNLKETRI